MSRLSRVAGIMGPWDRYAIEPLWYDVVCLVLAVLGFVLAGFLG